MELSKKNEYEIALVTRQAVMTVAELRDRIASIESGLRGSGVKPADSVLIYTDDERLLLAAIHASMRTGIQRITISKYAPDFSDANKIGIDCLTLKMYTAKSDTANDNTFHFSFPDESINDISVSEAVNFFDQLDAAIADVSADRLFLSRCLPFSRRVLEMIWASSRGITVVLDSLGSETPLFRYTAPGCLPEMQFGLFFFGSYVEKEDKNKYQLLFDAVRFADTHRFRAVWTPERHFNAFGGLYPNPSVLNAALAMITSTVQLRSGSLVSPLHHAVRIAEDWSLIDNLSNGRAAISFASGWQCDDFIFFPEAYPQRHEHMMQQIKVVQSLWGGGTARCKNGLGKEIDVSLFPKPVQSELPVWITVSGKLESFVDAGKIGANILTHLLWQNSEELVDKIAAYRQSLYENGFDPGSRIVSVMVHTFLGESNEVVKEKVRKPLTEYIRSSTQLIQNMAKSNASTMASAEVAGRYGGVDNDLPAHHMDELASIAFERFFAQASLLGTVEKAKKMIRTLKEYGVDELACLVDFGLEKADVLDSLQFLDRLRVACTPEEGQRYPVTITHCTAETLRRSAETIDLADFFAAQELLLIEGGAFENIPASLQHKTKIVRGTQVVSNGETRSSFFNALLADEF